MGSMIFNKLDEFLRLQKSENKFEEHSNLYNWCKIRKKSKPGIVGWRYSASGCKEQLPLQSCLLINITYTWRWIYSSNI